MQCIFIHNIDLEPYIHENNFRFDVVSDVVEFFDYIATNGISIVLKFKVLMYVIIIVPGMCDHRLVVGPV